MWNVFQLQNQAFVFKSKKKHFNFIDAIFFIKYCGGKKKLYWETREYTALSFVRTVN